MSRARNIKPGFFKNEYLAEVDIQGRLLFIGLWTLADREGRLEYRPKRIKAELFPYEDCDVADLICQLESCNFVKRYEVEGFQYLQILNFDRHQKPHPNEKASELPAPDHVITDREKGIPDRASSLNADSLNDDCGKDAPAKSERSAPHKIPDDWQPNEVNRQWLTDAGMTPAEQAEVIDEFKRWAKNSDHRKSNWDLAFSRNPAVKSAVGRRKTNGKASNRDRPQSAADRNREGAERFLRQQRGAER